MLDYLSSDLTLPKEERLSITTNNPFNRVKTRLPYPSTRKCQSIFRTIAESPVEQDGLIPSSVGKTWDRKICRKVPSFIMDDASLNEFLTEFFSMQGLVERVEFSK